eukprot:gene12794-17153_t
MFGYGISDALQSLDYLRNHVLGPRKSVGVDHAFITPTILDLGHFNESNIEELLEMTRGDRVVIWNLGASPISYLFLQSFQNQILDVPWKSPCQYTRAPTLNNVFSLCYSIKSWYDLNEKNLAIIHCPKGQPSTGILIACLLKFIGAFEYSAQAYDFYCSKRLSIADHADRNQTLAPSYRILFENVDKTVNNGGYLNNAPMYLKNLTLSSLPVEELPCIEVWDLSGLIFSSYIGLDPVAVCDWDEEDGDGFFKISKNILGDFSIVCRFGGHLATTKDKSTTIFKYQNSTAFIPNEVVELKYCNVDINPMYTDSIDADTFTVHMMFGNPDLSQYGEHDETPQLPAFHLPGIDSFEAGLDEISKHHAVMPEPMKSMELTELVGENSNRYATIALQLSNNSVDYAWSLLIMMQERIDILTTVVGDASSTDSDSVISGIASEQVKMTTKTSTDEMLKESNPRYSASDLDQCKVCYDAKAKPEQLIHCSKCTSPFHTHCLNLRKIPFGINTVKDKINRAKYMNIHYEAWKCNQCNNPSGSVHSDALEQVTEEIDQNKGIFIFSPIFPSSNNELKENVVNEVFDSQSIRIDNEKCDKMNSVSISSPSSRVITADMITTETGLPLNQLKVTPLSTSQTTGTGIERSPYPRIKTASPMRTKHDQVAILIGLLASCNITIESLLKMEESKQYETLKAIIEHKYNSEEPAMKPTFDLTTSLRNLLSQNKGLSNFKSESNTTVEESRHQLPNKNTKSYAIGLPTSTNITGHDLGLKAANESATNSTIEKILNIDSTAVLPNTLKVDATTGLDSNGVGFGGPGGSNSYPQEWGYSGGIGADGVAPVGFGGPLGGPNTYPQGWGYPGAYPQRWGYRGSPNGPYPYGYLVGVDGSNGANGFPGQGWDYPGGMMGGYTGNGWGYNNGGGYGGWRGSNGPTSAEPAKMKNIKQIAKYFKMVKVGIPKTSVAQKLFDQGIVTSLEVGLKVLNADPERPIPPELLEKLKLKEEESLKSAKDAPPAQVEKSKEEEAPSDKVKVSEHPTYMKYFTMLKCGLPKEVAKAKMKQEGVDPAILDKDPIELILLNDELPKSTVEKVPVSEHPTYIKYFKMLNVSLPKEAVKAKMKQGGVDPLKIDIDPSELIPLNDSSYLDKDPTELIPLVTVRDIVERLGTPELKDEPKLEGVTNVPCYENPIHANEFKIHQINDGNKDDNPDIDGDQNSDSDHSIDDKHKHNNSDNEGDIVYEEVRISNVVRLPDENHHLLRG